LLIPLAGSLRPTHWLPEVPPLFEVPAGLCLAGLRSIVMERA
jgi:hypothetical protein